MNPRLVITGTRNGRPDVWDALDRWCGAFGTPSVLVLGDQVGVDAGAADWARAYKRDQRPGHDFEVKIERAARSARGRVASEALRARTARMIDWCEPGDHLLALPDPYNSPGTWLCHLLGQRTGLLCAVVEPGRPWLHDLAKRHALHYRWRTSDDIPGLQREFTW